MSKLPWVDSPADELAFQKFKDRFEPFHFKRIIPLPSDKKGESSDNADIKTGAGSPSENSPCH